MARELGAGIAAAGHTLIFGGGRRGLMADVCDSCLAEGGRVHGIILDQFIGEGHPALQGKLEIHTSMWDRKRALVEAADALIALPGGLGTLEELAEVLSLSQLAILERPVVILNWRGFYDPLMQQIEHCEAAGFIHAPQTCRWIVASSASAAIGSIATLDF